MTRSKSSRTPPEPSRRERQILDAIHSRGEATVAQVLESIADPPSYSAVRATMGLLVDKGHLKFRRDGQTYVYRPVESTSRARGRAIRRLLHVFFGGSRSKAVAALLESGGEPLDDEEYARLSELLDRAHGRGKGRKRGGR